MTSPVWDAKSPQAAQCTLGCWAERPPKWAMLPKTTVGVVLEML